MILKRVLPVIAAIAVLCCMIIVPASASSFGSGTNVWSFVPFAGIEVTSVLVTDSDPVIFSGSQPDRFFPDSQSWSSDGISGSVAVPYVYSYLLEGGSANQTFYFPGASRLLNFNFHVDPFVVSVRDLLDTGLLSISVPANCSVSGSLKVAAVSSDGGVYVNDYSFDDDHYPVAGDFNPFFALDLADEYLDQGLAEDDLLLIYDTKVYLDLSGTSVNTVDFSVFAGFTEPLAVLSDFLFDNGIIYGGVDNVVDGSVILQGFSGFLIDGVGAFLATPMFGDFSLGEMLAGVVSVILALVILKLFGH